MSRKKKLTTAIVLLLLVAAVAVGTAIFGVFEDTTTTTETVDIETASASQGDRYGLQPEWQKAYNGTGSHEYTFPDDTGLTGTKVTNQCANCHLDSNNSDDTINHKNDWPYHNRSLFWDNDEHRGPNTQVADESVIQPLANWNTCGMCHTRNTVGGSSYNQLQDTNGFGEEINYTNDPHSVHRHIYEKFGCIRCHVYNNRTFTSGTLTFTQGNATRSSYGIANPINMTSMHEAEEGEIELLSSLDEANYSYDAGAGGLNTSGTGFNVYGSNDSTMSTQYGCSDCHDSLHRLRSIAFAFNDSSGSRKGPWAEISHANSPGAPRTEPPWTNISDFYTCGDCHVTDAHSVHTTGDMNSTGSFTDVTSGNIGRVSGAAGAFFCDECHSQNVIQPEMHHEQGIAEQLALVTNTSSTNYGYEPYERAENPTVDAYTNNSDPAVVGEKCGLCHE